MENAGNILYRQKWAWAKQQHQPTTTTRIVTNEKKHRRGRQKTVMCKIWAHAHAHAHVRHVRNSDAFGQIELNSNRLINNRSMSTSTECALSHCNFAGSFCRNQSQPIAFGILVVCWCRGLVYFVLCVRTRSTVDMMISFGPKRMRRIQCSWNDKLLCARSPAMHD